jgi:phytoene desaturase
MEKNDQVGGHASQLTKNGYTFDMGPSLITAPDIIEGVFKAAGRNMSDYLNLIQLDPYYRIYFHDKTYTDYSGDSEEMKIQMAKFHSPDAKNYDRFMKDCKEIYNAVITDGLGSEPFSSWKTMLKFVPRAIKLNALFPSFSFVKRYFKHPKKDVLKESSPMIRSLKQTPLFRMPMLPIPISIWLKRNTAENGGTKK